MWNLPWVHISYQFFCLKFHNCEHPRAPADDTFDHEDIEVFNQNSNLRKKKGNSSNNKKTETEETNEIIDAPSETTINAVKILMSETKDERGKRGKYFKYSPELREQIAEYAQKHGSLEAANHFSNLLGSVITTL